MRVLVSGSSGLIGSRVVTDLLAAGHEMHRLVRRPDATPHEVSWDPLAGRIDAEVLEGFDAVVHLAGENIGGKRWTRERKERIRTSRVAGTRLLCEALAARQRPPRTLICASALGYYGDRGDEVLTEESPPGKGFLPEVCKEWEAAALPVRSRGTRIVWLRIGIVLAREGGALPRMLTPFRLGLGGRLGSGRQWMSWIAREDVVRIVRFVLQHDDLEGPVNAASPDPVTNAEFTKTLARVLRRPALLPVPAFVLRLLLGEMADELLLSSTRMTPARLTAAGFVFAHPRLEDALRRELGPLGQASPT